MRVLLTGFAPFPGVPVNASMRLVPELAELARRRFPGTEVSAGVLPTEWQAAPRQMEVLLAETRPDLLLHFGVSSRARGFEIEQRGQNRCQLQVDAAGALPASCAVREGGPDTMPASLPVSYIVARLRRLVAVCFTATDRTAEFVSGLPTAARPFAETSPVEGRALFELVRTMGAAGVVINAGSDDQTALTGEDIAEIVGARR